MSAHLGLTLQIRRCLNTACPQCRQPYRPEEEGRLALPKHEFGLDVMAFVGQQRYGHHRSVPEIHQALVERCVAVAPRVGIELRCAQRLMTSTFPQAPLRSATVGFPE